MTQNKPSSADRPHPKQQNTPSAPQPHTGPAHPQHEAQKPIPPEQHQPQPQHKTKKIGADVIDARDVAAGKQQAGGDQQTQAGGRAAGGQPGSQGQAQSQSQSPSSSSSTTKAATSKSTPAPSPSTQQQPQQQQQQQQPQQQQQQQPTSTAQQKKKDSCRHEPPTQHLHSKAAHAKGKEHAFGGHSIPRAESDSCDPRKLYPAPPYEEHTQESPAIEGKMKYLPDFGEHSYTGSGKLKGKVCLITGGDSGIGRAVSLAFAREGADAVFIQHLPEEHADMQETARVVEAADCSFSSCPIDLATDAACKQMIDAAVGKFGRIDVLVLNAAMQGKTLKSIAELTPDRLQKTFAVNVQSIFHTLRHALPHMQPGSSVITTTSIQATDPSGFIADYAASKGAVSNITSSLCPELLTKGIRINSVAPGPVWTPLIAQSFPKENLKKFGSGDLGQGVYGRPAQPCELAPAFVFLANNTDSSYVNGSVIHVDGGH